MHSRSSSRLRALARVRRYNVRSASTAASVKLAAPDLGKWARPQPETSQNGSGSQTGRDLGKWARQPQPQTSQAPDSQEAGPSYTPNPGRWARPPAGQTQRRSLLDVFDTPRHSENSQTVFDDRSHFSRARVNALQKTPNFPSDADPQTGSSPNRDDKKQERDLAPHLALGRQERPSQIRPAQDNGRTGSLSGQGSTESSGQDTPGLRPQSRPVASVYVEDYGPESVDAGKKDASKRMKRNIHKERGSVIQRLESGGSVEIPYRSRAHHDRSELAKKNKKKPQEKQVAIDIAIPSVVSVANLARLLDIRLETLQSCMYRNDMEELSSHDHMLSADDASLLAMEFNRNPVIDDEAAFDIYASPPHPDQASLPRRPPIVTIMGHVDHGKTTLLDTLRSSSVAKGEAGGITQHIGAFSVPAPSALISPDTPHSITFLDTPGHAAFSAMRARGARVTDIIVLVVAADDGVMPQTREVIDLIKKDKDKVGVVVAINKVDKPGVDVEKVQTALWAEGIEIEAMGGDVPSVEVSGLTGHGLDNLVETISLLAELQDIRAESDGPVHGYVLESKVAKGFGNTATVLVVRGKLTPSSHIIGGTTYAKVRRLMDQNGATVKSAGPGSAVIVSGWRELPSAGDEVLQRKESDVKLAVENRKRKVSLAATLADAEAINAVRRREREEKDKKAQEAVEGTDHEPAINAAKELGPKELRLVIKGDVSGSVEALAGAVQGIGNKDAVTKVVSTGVGEVTESDVMLAKAAEGMIIAFSTNVSRTAEQAAAQSEVPIYRSNVIYNVLDEVKEKIIQLLPKTVETRVSAEANVVEIFEISGKAKSTIKVAGCRVSNGVVQKDKQVRVVRDGEVVYDGTLSTLRILKRDVSEVKKGLECGISINGFDDLRVGDFLQFHYDVEKPGQL